MFYGYEIWTLTVQDEEKSWKQWKFGLGELDFVLVALKGKNRREYYYLLLDQKAENLLDT